MKKLLLLFVGLVALTANGQIEIRKGTESTNIMGTEITFDIDLNEVPAGDEWAFSERLKMYVRNIGESDRKTVIVRELLEVPAGWKDNVCWASQCYTTQASEIIYNTPASPTSNMILLSGLLQDSVLYGGLHYKAEIKPQFFPGMGNPGETAKYKYSVKDVNTEEILGSVTVRVNYLNNVSVNAVKSIELSVAPNPATDVVSVNAEGIVGGTLKVVDMLGNVVFASEFNNSKKVNTSDFKNGVYFLTVQSGNAKGFTKKLVVRH